MSFSPLKCHTFTGRSIKSLLPAIARVRLEVMRDFPYLIDRPLHEELSTLAPYGLAKEAIAVVIFDNSEVVGASLGIPLASAEEPFQRPIPEKDRAGYFFFRESVLLPHYRGRGIGHHFFEMRESHVELLGDFHTICFFSVEREESHPKWTDDHAHLHSLWRRLGYAKNPKLHCKLNWRDVGMKTVTEKELPMWSKNLR